MSLTLNAMPDGRSLRGQALAVVVLACSFEGGLGLLALVIARLTGRPLLAYLSWDANAAVAGLMGSLPLGLIFVVCISWPVGPLRRIATLAREVIVPLFAPCTPLDLLVVAVAAGLGEELLFRGLLQQALTNWLGTWGSLVAASVVFGLFHPFTPTYVLLAALAGLVLGVLWLITGNLLAPVVAHGVYDWVALVYLVRSEKRLTATSTDL